MPSSTSFFSEIPSQTVSSLLHVVTQCRSSRTCVRGKSSTWSQVHMIGTSTAPQIRKSQMVGLNAGIAPWCRIGKPLVGDCPGGSIFLSAMVHLKDIQIVHRV